MCACSKSPTRAPRMSTQDCLRCYSKNRHPRIPCTVRDIRLRFVLGCRSMERISCLDRQGRHLRWEHWKYTVPLPQADRSQGPQLDRWCTQRGKDSNVGALLWLRASSSWHGLSEAVELARHPRSMEYTTRKCPAFFCSGIAEHALRGTSVVFRLCSSRRRQEFRVWRHC